MSGPFVDDATGLERQLGGEAHDGAVRGGERRLQLPVGRLQGGARIHRRLHLPVDALQRGQPDAQRGALPQTDGRLVINDASLYLVLDERHNKCKKDDVFRVLRVILMLLILLVGIFKGVPVFFSPCSRFYSHPHIYTYNSIDLVAAAIIRYLTVRFTCT